jgi:hypothetical protein
MGPGLAFLSRLCCLCPSVNGNLGRLRESQAVQWRVDVISTAKREADLGVPTAVFEIKQSDGMRACVLGGFPVGCGPYVCADWVPRRSSV